MTSKAPPFPIAAVSETAGFTPQWCRPQTNKHRPHNPTPKSRSTTNQPRAQMTSKVTLPVAAVSETAGFTPQWCRPQTNDYWPLNPAPKSRFTSQQFRATSP
jgi:hypothetical protein